VRQHHFALPAPTIDRSAGLVLLSEFSLHILLIIRAEDRFLTFQKVGYFPVPAAKDQTIITRTDDKLAAVKPEKTLEKIRMRVFVIMVFAASAFAQSPGDPSRGKEIFEGKGNCTSCHRVNGNGSRIGPDLSDIGIPRPAGGVGPGFGGTAAGNAKNLEIAILDPDAETAISNRSVRVVTKTGATFTGRLLNQDNFTVQMIDEQGKLRSFVKSDLRESGVLTKSPMPSYKGKLSDPEVADLVAYLMSLKGAGK
jgi:putative heme-binding domain-containing protein